MRLFTDNYFADKKFLWVEDGKRAFPKKNFLCEYIKLEKFLIIY